jgi:hypothetical protein
MVMVAVALLPLLLFAGFAIDISHWWDYSRNLQNRADAAATAAGTAFMGTGFATMCANVSSSTPALGYALPQRIGGDFAQLFSGPGNNERWPNVPYGVGAPEPDLTPPPGDAKVFSETSSAAHTYNSYMNVPNLNAAKLNNYFVLLNAKNYIDKLTGTDLANPDFGMGNVCNADPHLDQTDLDPGAAGPMVDVKVTQENVPLFFPLIGIHPKISEHARVQLTTEGAGSAKAIAVKNPALTQCARVWLRDDATGTLVGSWASSSPIIGAAGQPIEFDISAPSATFNGTGADAVSASVFLGDGSDNCNVSGDGISTTGNGLGDLYDGFSANAQGSGHNNIDPSLGLLRINEFASGGSGLRLGSVTLSNAGCTNAGDTAAQNPYFFDFWASLTAPGCSVTLNANVLGLGSQSVCAKDIDTNTTMKMTGTGPFTATFPIARFTGHHSFLVGTHNGNNCNGQAPNWFNGGNPVQQTYAGFDDDNGQQNGQNPVTIRDDSGPIAALTIRDANNPNPATNVVDSVANGTTKSLSIKVFVQGLKYQPSSAPPVILRTGAQGSTQTGVVDCGEGNGGGNGGNGVSGAIINGCPKTLTMNTRGTCTPPPTAAMNPWDCVNTIPGNRDKLPEFIASIINPTPTHNGCSANNWPAYVADPVKNPILPTDPRVMTFIVTGAFNLDGNASPSWIPVLQLADFYVTGWDDTLQNKYQCDSGPGANEAYPLPSIGNGNGNNDPTNAAFWGHWFQDVTLGTGSQNACVVGSFGNCVPVLTR